LLRRVANKNAFATGELLRAAIGRPYFWLVVGKDHNCLLCLLVAGWWMTVLLTPVMLSDWSAVFVAGAILLFPLAVMLLRWRSIRLALYSLAAWNVYALSFWPGLLRPRASPSSWIESTVVQASAPRIGDAPGGRRVATSRDTLRVPAGDADALRSLP
jgi:hypothetical protein